MLDSLISHNCKPIVIFCSYSTCNRDSLTNRCHINHSQFTTVLLEILHHSVAFHANLRHAAHYRVFLTRLEMFYATLGFDADVSSPTIDNKPRNLYIAMKCPDADLYRWCSKLLEAAGYRVRMLEAPYATSRESGQGRAVLTVFLQSTLNDEAIAWCKTYSATNAGVPLLVISKQSDAESELLVLRAGADRYLSFPVVPELLAAHIETLERRFVIPQPESCALLRADPVSRSVWIADSELRLSPVLFRLLSQFLAHPREVLSFEALLASIQTDRKQLPRNVVKAYVHQLRKILTPHGFPDVIKTLHRVGYRFDPPITQ